MRKLLVLLLIIYSSLPISARDCLGYERELEGYFFQYKSGEMVDLPLVERLNKRCNSPSSKFNMLYFYFLSVDAYHSNQLTDEEAFEQASGFYEKCASYFSDFDWSKNDKFLESFYTRAEGLEVVLADLAFDLGYKSRIRYVQKSRSVDGSPWKKTNITGFSDGNGSVGRGQNHRDEVTQIKTKFSRKSPMFQPNPTYDKSGEPFGYVGNISSVNPIDYLKYLATTDSRNQQYLYSNESERDEAIAEYARYRGRGSYSEMSVGEEELPEGDFIGINERTFLLDRPGGVNTSGNYAVGFGENVYRLPSESPVVNQGETYIKVEASGGRTGWMAASSLVEMGELAVLIENTRGIPKINMRAEDRNAILFKAGELVVLEDYRNGMVKAVNRNGSKSAWIQNIGNISIEEEDIQIAKLLHYALNNYSSRELRSQLEAIKYIPGYGDSPLARIVEDYIRRYERN